MFVRSSGIYSSHFFVVPYARAFHSRQRNFLSLFRKVHLKETSETALRALKYDCFYPPKSEEPQRNWHFIAAGIIALVTTSVFLYSMAQQDPVQDPVEEIKKALQNDYLSKDKITRLIPGTYGPIKTEIEDIFTRLAIIDEGEKHEKEQIIKKEQPGVTPEEIKDGRIPTHESIFKPKRPIELQDLFDEKNFNSAKEKRILIEGAAGIGKSTLCQYIAYQWAKKSYLIRNLITCFGSI